MNKCKSKLIEYACEIINSFICIRKLQKMIYESDMREIDYRNANRILRETVSGLKNEIADLKTRLEYTTKKIQFLESKEDEN